MSAIIEAAERTTCHDISAVYFPTPAYLCGLLPNTGPARPCPARRPLVRCSADPSVSGTMCAISAHVPPVPGGPDRRLRSPGRRPPGPPGRAGGQCSRSPSSLQDAFCSCATTINTSPRVRSSVNCGPGHIEQLRRASLKC